MAQAGTGRTDRTALDNRFAARMQPTGDVTRYSRFVGVMKVLLPLGAVGLLLVLAIWPKLVEQGASDQFVIVMKEIGSVDDDLRMIAPSYRGTDAAGRTYSVDAASAVPDGPDPTQVGLTDLRAGMTNPDGRGYVLTATAGIYFPRSEELEVSGDVTLTSTEGYVATGTAARIDMAAGTVISEVPVKATGPVGTLTAGRMEAHQRENVIRFENSVRLIVTLRDRKGGSPDAAAGSASEANGG